MKTYSKIVTTMGWIRATNIYSIYWLDACFAIIQTSIDIFNNNYRKQKHTQNVLMKHTKHTLIDDHAMFALFRRL